MTGSRFPDSPRGYLKYAVNSFIESIKWGNPVYEKEGKVYYLAATKAYVSLGFFKGAGLSDPNQVTVGTGKNLRHVKIRHGGAIRRHQLTAWVQEAVALNPGRSR